MRWAKKHRPPKVRVWQRISRDQLTDWFQGVNASADHYTGIIQTLCDKGFLIPKDGGEFKSKSGNNIVDPYALGQLIALLYRAKISDVLVREDTYVKEVVSNYLFDRLIPYMLENDIKPHSKYTISEASNLIGRPLSTVYQAAIRGAIPSCNGKGKLYIKGVDLAIYALKHTDKLTWYESDVADLFGVEKLNLSELGLLQSEHNTFARHRHVFPLYEMIAGYAKKQLITPGVAGSTPIQIGETVIYLSARAQMKYCEAFGVEYFGGYCFEHVYDQLNNGASIRRGTIKTPHFTLKLQGNVVTDVSLRVSA